MTNTQEAFDEWHDNTYGVKPSFNRNHEGCCHWDGDKQDRWEAWQACKSHNDAVMAELQAEVQHWKANHAHEVERARLLKVRTDLPIERLQAYDRASIDNVNELAGALEEIKMQTYQPKALIVVHAMNMINEIATKVLAKHKKGL